MDPWWQFSAGMGGRFGSEYAFPDRKTQGLWMDLQFGSSYRTPAEIRETRSLASAMRDGFPLHLGPLRQDKGGEVGGELCVVFPEHGAPPSEATGTLSPQEAGIEYGPPN